MKKFYQFCKMVGEYVLTGLVCTVVIAIVLAVVIPIVTFVVGHVCLVIMALGLAFGVYDLGGIEMIGALTFIFDIIFLPFLLPFVLMFITWVLERIPEAQIEEVQPEH
jgi:hypothetical protein